MLKAYDFLGVLPNRDSLQPITQYNEELCLAKKIVEELLSKEKETRSTCSMCGSRNVDHFFKKWGIQFYLCNDCESVFLKQEDEILYQYKENQELINYRNGLEYQSEAAKHRDISWNEVIDWISFRSFRYLGKNKGLNVADYGNRYQFFVDLIRNSELCEKYSLKHSILYGNITKFISPYKYDIVLYLDRLQQCVNPDEELRLIYEELNKDGLLFLSTRLGTGFDILVLKEYASIYPYEHMLLPSGKGLINFLEKLGFEVLDFSTPGQMDIGYVIENFDNIDASDYFIKHLVKNNDQTVVCEFQRFLQKCGMSSHGRIVARKVGSK